MLPVIFDTVFYPIYNELTIQSYDDDDNDDDDNDDDDNDDDALVLQTYYLCLIRCYHVIIFRRR